MAFNQETADRICERLAAGESLRKACVDGPDPSTILRWTEDNDAFAQQYARARSAGYSLLADELVEIADDSTNDTYTDEDGNVRTNQEVVARSRLRVDTRKWMLSKMLPKVYGDKLELGGSLTVKKQAADMSDDELAAIALGRKQDKEPVKVLKNTAFDHTYYPNGDLNA